MAVEPAAKRMTSEEIVALNRAHTFFSWSVQGALDPIAIDHAEGVYLYTPEGQPDPRLQQPADVGEHRPRRPAGDRRDHRAGARSSSTSCPAFATEIRGRLGQKLAEILPGDLDKVFFTLGGAEAIENAIKLARHHTGRHKVLARYRAYHGATFGAMTLTGDPRRWANEPGLVGVVRYPDTHRWGEKEPRPVAESLQGLEDVIRYEGAHTIAAVFLETIVGTNGILIPPDGYIQGVREICTRNNILMVCDEVMAGFGRTGPLVRRRPLGRRARPDDDGQGPDELVPAARRRGDAPRDRRGVRDEDVLRRPDLLVAPGQPRRGAGDDRGLRGGRPDRQRPAARAGDARPPRAPRREAPVGRARRGTSACSGSSTSSGAAIRGRRSRRTTARRTR